MKNSGEEEIRKEITRGRKSLKSAQKLFEEHLFEDAISRAYYAVLHSARAVLLAENVKVDSHEAVKRLFGKYLIKTGKIDTRFSKILREEQDERYLADYDVAFSPDPERVEKRIEDAKEFLDSMVNYLNERNVKVD